MRSNPARMFPSLAVFALASAIALPAAAQQGQSATGSQDSNPPSTAQQQPSPTAKPLNTQSKEGF
jgi:hypothetical protein